MVIKNYYPGINMLRLALMVRLLKELGIYKTFLVERKRYLKKTLGFSDGYLFEPRMLISPASLIFNAFAWGLSDNQNLWSKIYKLIEYEHWDHIKILLENENLLNDLKECVQT